MVKISLMIEGGKASTSPAMAQTLGPLKMDMNKILEDINEKTSSYAGLKVPVELDVNEKDKTYTITIKSPPAAELIKSELKLKKGSGEPEKKKAGNISVEQIIKIAKMKMESLFTTDLRASMKSMAGTCNSLGVLIEGNVSAEFNKLLAEGKYDDLIKSESEVSPEKVEELNAQLVQVQEELDKKFAKKQKKDKEKKEEKKEEVKEGEEKKEEANGEKKEEKKEDKKEEKKK
jgi:large subunit ribosomal protein L11